MRMKLELVVLDHFFAQISQLVRLIDVLAGRIPLQLVAGTRKRSAEARFGLLAKLMLQQGSKLSLFASVARIIYHCFRLLSSVIGLTLRT